MHTSILLRIKNIKIRGNEVEYTKGEWKVHPNYDWVVGENNQVVANCTGYDNQHDNAQLISAAPDMYGALKGILPLIESFTPYQRTRPEIINAQMALAKAERK